MSNRMRIVVAALLAAFLAGLLVYLGQRGKVPTPTQEVSFVADSTQLKATRFVATLDEPAPKGANTIWCASFLCAWKALEEDLAKEPLSMSGDPPLVGLLNKAPDPRPQVPEAALYTAAGWEQKGIIGQIRDALERKFPGKSPPDFPGIVPGSFVAYAYLEAGVKFGLPYFQSRRPLVFTDSAGNKTKVSSFGIRQEDANAYYKLREQAQVLYVKTDGNREKAEFVVDLDRTSNPTQILLAMIEPKPTLGELLLDLEQKMKASAADTHWGGGEIGPDGVLLVPDIAFVIAHEFSELLGHEFTNTALKGQRVDAAQQDTSFSLDRSGAELSSEAKMYMKAAADYLNYVFDKPFLICMRKRDASQPYFAMWIDNAELLQPW